MSPSCSGRRVGDAVADDLVHRGAHALRVAVVVERRRVAVTLDVQFVDVGVELVGGEPGADVLAGEAQDLGGQPAGDPHAGDDVGRLHRAARPTAPLRRSRRTAADRSSSGTGRIGDTMPGSTRPSDALVAALVLPPAAAPARVVGLGQHHGGMGERLHRRPRIGPAPAPRRAASSAVPAPIIGRRWRTSAPSPLPRKPRRSSPRSMACGRARRPTPAETAAAVGVEVQRSVVEPAGPAAPRPALDLSGSASSRCRSS